jgi:hypothetical protein
VPPRFGVPPVYRDTWDLPGGAVEAEESPHASLIDAAGAAGAAVFLIDMNKAFEDFGASRLTRYLVGHLIYCQHDGSAPPQHIDVRNLGTRLATWALRLDRTPGHVEQELQALAMQITE